MIDPLAVLWPPLPPLYHAASLHPRVPPFLVYLCLAFQVLQVVSFFFLFRFFSSEVLLGLCLCLFVSLSVSLSSPPSLVTPSQPRLQAPLCIQKQTPEAPNTWTVRVEHTFLSFELNTSSSLPLLCTSDILTNSQGQDPVERPPSRPPSLPSMPAESESSGPPTRRTPTPEAEGPPTAFSIHYGHP